MSTVLALAPRLAVARIRNSRGGMMLDALAVAAFSICTALVLTVAGGAWMFVQRRMNPTQAMADALGGGSMSNLGDSPSLYVFLACLACGLLVVPILTLGGGAARLGAQGRARRLASLRLLGVTGGEVTLMAALESLVQAGIGAVIGSLLYLVTLPAWGGVSFEGVHIGAGEMLLPAWAWLGLIGLVLLLAGLSALFGLQGVRISPLGVAKRQTPPALRAWRAALLFAALVVYVITALGMRITNIEWGMYLTLLAMLGSGLWWLSQRPYFTLRDAAILAAEGHPLRHVSPSLLRAAVKREVRGNFFSIDLDAVRTTIETVPWVRRASVRRVWPDGLEVAIEEHRTLALWGDGRLVNTLSLIHI